MRRTRSSSKMSKVYVCYDVIMCKKSAVWLRALKIHDMPTSSQSSMPPLCLPASFFASKKQQQQQHAPSLPWPAERKPPCGFYYTTLILHFSMHFVFCCSIIYYYTLVLTLFPLVRFLFFSHFCNLD